MTAVLLIRTRLRAGMGESSPYASAAITVSNDIATTTVSATDYTWPVEVGGAGAPAGKLDYANGYGLFTVSAVNYRFPVMLSGAGGAAISVTNGIATVTTNSTDIEWPVDEV